MPFPPPPDTALLDSQGSRPSESVESLPSPFFKRLRPWVQGLRLEVEPQSAAGIEDLDCDASGAAGRENSFLVDLPNSRLTRPLNLNPIADTEPP